MTGVETSARKGQVESPVACRSHVYMAFIFRAGSLPLDFICVRRDLPLRLSRAPARTERRRCSGRLSLCRRAASGSASAASGPRHRRRILFDVIFLVIGCGFLAAAGLYVIACDRL